MTYMPHQDKYSRVIYPVASGDYAWPNGVWTNTPNLVLTVGLLANQQVMIGVRMTVSKPVQEDTFVIFDIRIDGPLVASRLSQINDAAASYLHTCGRYASEALNAGFTAMFTAPAAGSYTFRHQGQQSPWYGWPYYLISAEAPEMWIEKLRT